MFRPDPAIIDGGVLSGTACDSPAGGSLLGRLLVICGDLLLCERLEVGFLVGNGIVENRDSVIEGEGLSLGGCSPSSEARSGPMDGRRAGLEVGNDGRCMICAMISALFGLTGVGIFSCGLLCVNG
jgi:hypothetical protein